MRNQITKIVAVVLLLGWVLVGLSFGQDFSTPTTHLVPIENQTGFNPPNPGGVWQLTPRAKHHHAVVRVTTPIGGGTGAVIAMESGPGMLVVTNHHVVERAMYSKETFRYAKIDVSDGRDGYLPIVWSDPNRDVAVLYSAKGKSNYGLPVAAYDPPIGSKLEMCGFGGPTDKLRTFAAQRIAHDHVSVAINAPTVSGDSGGPILHHGSVVGVNFGSSGGRTLGAIDNPGGPWPLQYPACSKIDGPNLADVLTRICQPRGCRPRIIYEPPGTPTPTEPPAQPTPQNGTAEIDYQRLAAELAKRPELRGLQDADIAAIVQQQISAHMPAHDRRVVIADGKTRKIIDDETYGPQEPIVIDVQNIINAAKRQ